MGLGGLGAVFPVWSSELEPASEPVVAVDAEEALAPAASVSTVAAAATSAGILARSTATAASTSLFLDLLELVRGLRHRVLKLEGSEKHD